jgi:hypothetical protein
MKILLQFPTLGRPIKFLNALEKYASLSSNEHKLHFNINCDKYDPTMNDSEVISQINKVVNGPNFTCSINFDENTNKIGAINDHINEHDFDVVVCLSDDMIPQVKSWDDIIAKNMQEFFPDTDGCLHFNDGNQGNKLITLSILGRKLYDSFGYIYHPDYKSLYCDDEFTKEVYRLNKVKYIDQIIISHQHYSVEGTINYGDYDVAAYKTLYYSGRDERVFQERQRLGFPKERITND